MKGFGSAIVDMVIIIGAAIVAVMVGVALGALPAQATPPAVTYDVRQPCFQVIQAKDVPNGPPIVLLFDSCAGTFRWKQLPAPAEGVA